MIECIQSFGWTGYMLMKVRHDLLEVGFVKVPGDDEGSTRMFVDISAEHIVKIGEPRFSQTKDVTVPNVPLETYPGSKIVHLILQGLDISEQNTR